MNTLNRSIGDLQKYTGADIMGILIINHNVKYIELLLIFGVLLLFGVQLQASARH